MRTREDNAGSGCEPAHPGRAKKIAPGRHSLFGNGCRMQGVHLVFLSERASDPDARMSELGSEDRIEMVTRVSVVA
jgi:hypothetical protein